MRGKKKSLMAFWMVWVLLLTTVSVPVDADGTDIAVKLYNETMVLKPGAAAGSYEMGVLSPGMALDGNQAKLVQLYGTDLKGNCPDGYMRDGWRIWRDESGLAAGRWISDADADWASYLTGYFDLNNGNVMLAPNWVPEYAAGKINSADSAAVIKKAENGAELINGNTIADGSVEADGSVKVDGTTFHFQWLHEYKLVETPADENQIKGTVSGSGDYYNESTGKWMKGNGELGSLGIVCELQAGDVVVVKDIGSEGSDVPYYFNGYLWNEDSFSQTYLETYDKENKVFYAVVPKTGKNYTLCLRNMNYYMDINASVSVFRADSTVTDQTSAVYTGDAGTYCCQISYEKDVMNESGQLENKTFKLLSDIVTFAEKYTITLPEGEGYIAAVKAGSSSSVAEGGSYSFTITVESGYEPTENFKVLANGIELRTETDSPYTYTIENITCDQVITVEGISEIKDTEKPVISGVEEGKEYYGVTVFCVVDASPVEVWLDGKQIQLDKDGAYAIQPDNESHTITVTDEAGNTVSSTITVYETWVRDGIVKDGDYSLKNGIGYKLGNGKWKVSGDDTVYAGGNTFYVSIAQRYSLALQSGISSGIMNPLGCTILKQ